VWGMTIPRISISRAGEFARVNCQFV
jgi:hypothetical protein